MAEVPVFLVAVPSPSGIGVGIMTAAVVPVWAGMCTGGKVFPIRRRMGDHGRTITGNGKASRTEQAKAQGREYGKDRKDFLQGRFGVWGGGLPFHDRVNNILSSDGRGVFGFDEFAIGTDHLFWFLPVFADGEQGGAGINIPRCEPEAVHKIIVRAERRQVIGGRAAGEDGKGNGIGEDIIDP